VWWLYELLLQENSWSSALFSFFIPGLGQLVKGQVSKAIGIWAALLISLFMSVIGIGFLIGMVVWIAQIYDAYNA
jgi:TM2 domain-containing membrane protein YozV